MSCSAGKWPTRKTVTNSWREGVSALLPGSAGRTRRPAPAPPKTIERQSVSPAQSPNPASIVAIESDLTRYIGPIARILVKRELGKFESLAKLCLVLATHIPNEGERRAFLNAHGAE